MRKPILLLSAMTCLAIAAASAAGGPPQAAGGKASAKAAADAEARAKKIYAIDCALCHADNGNGQTDLAKSMDLKLADWTEGKTLPAISDQDIFNIIRKGKDKMPGEDVGRASDEEVKNLVVYIRTLSKSAPTATASNN